MFCFLQSAMISLFIKHISIQKTFLKAGIFKRTLLKTMTHKTKGIVLRTVKYGETSIITTMLTELFGVQTYMVKGVRQSTKKSAGKAMYFQPGAILDMEVYHNENKNLQFVKEYQWGFLYHNVFFDVVKNSVALFIVEMVTHCMKQPEANPELYYLVEDALQQTDTGTPLLTANIPLFFTLQLGANLGFQIQGSYSEKTPVVDLAEGLFICENPIHLYFLEGKNAEVTSQFLEAAHFEEITDIILNRTDRRELLQAFQNYMAIHVQDFGEMKSVAILQEVLG